MLRALAIAATLLAAPALSQSVGPLIVEGDAQARSLDCAGRDVVVRGERNRLNLTGGCRSLEVTGGTSEILAELAPGARVSLRGDTIALRWAQLGAGPAPRIATEGQGISVAQLPAGAPGRESQLQRRETPRGVALNLSGDVLFASGADRLRGEAAEGLAEVAELIRTLRPQAIRIVGHTDAVGDEALNRELSLRRARAVQRWLEERVGSGAMPAVVVEGRGEAEPVAPNDAEDGRARNRRVEFVLER